MANGRARSVVATGWRPVVDASLVFGTVEVWLIDLSFVR